MQRRTTVLALLAVTTLPLVLGLAACSGDDTTAPPDAGGDATKDATGNDAAADAAKDSGTDATIDAAKDGATPDATSDATTDASTDAVADVSSDALGDASDASSDAKADVTDASSDATSDASDAGSGSVWKTPTCDGTIGSGEYGSSQNQLTTGGGQDWYMTWNATNLYVAVTNATVTEAVVLYAGFGGNNGLTAGQVYDNTAPGTLLFKADAVLYAKSTYNEVRKVAGNAWGAPTAAAITFCGSGSTREMVIPWSALGSNQIPASFRWVAYATSSGGFVYGQVPTTNPGGSIGTSANFPHDFFVSSTNDGSGAFPFATVE